MAEPCFQHEARDQLVKIKRSLGNQVRGLLRPFGIRLPSRVGTKKFAETAHQAMQNDPVMHASIAALLEALVSIDAQVGKLDAELKELAGRSEVAWRLMSNAGWHTTQKLELPPNLSRSFCRPLVPN